MESNVIFKHAEYFYSKYLIGTVFLMLVKYTLFQKNTFNIWNTYILRGDSIKFMKLIIKIL